MSSRSQLARDMRAADPTVPLSAIERATGLSRSSVCRALRRKPRQRRAPVVRLPRPRYVPAPRPSRLTAADVQRVLELSARGYSSTQIAAEVGICASYARHIVNGRYRPRNLRNTQAA